MDIQRQKATQFIHRLLANPGLQDNSPIQKEEQIIQFLKVNGDRLFPTLSSNAFFPGQSWSQIHAILMQTLREVIDLDAVKRGRLFYKNYRSYGLLGAATLQSLEWTCPDDQIFPYETGSKSGPYMVSANSTALPGESLVIDFECDEDDDWVAVQVPVSSGQGLMDLSHVQGVTLSYKAIDVSGNFDIFLHVGELGENIDGDDELTMRLHPRPVASFSMTQGMTSVSSSAGDQNWKETEKQTPKT